MGASFEKKEGKRQAKQEYALDWVAFDLLIRFRDRDYHMGIVASWLHFTLAGLDLRVHKTTSLY
jgi:hypothetical protein